MNDAKTPGGSPNKVGAMLDITVEKMRAMADSGTIIGDPITVGEVTLIPVSKMACGFASGGSDFPSKTSGGLFGGGGGGGVTVTPVAFLAVREGQVEVLPITPAASGEVAMGAAERAIVMAPELLEQVKKLFQKNKDDHPAEG